MALKKARRSKPDAGLNITSMMDMMTIILVFLLKSYSTQDISVAPSEDLELPVSTVKKAPEMAQNRGQIGSSGAKLPNTGSF